MAKEAEKQLEVEKDLEAASNVKSKEAAKPATKSPKEKKPADVKTAETITEPEIKQVTPEVAKVSTPDAIKQSDDTKTSAVAKAGTALKEVVPNDELDDIKKSTTCDAVVFTANQSIKLTHPLRVYATSVAAKTMRLYQGIVCICDGTLHQNRVRVAISGVADNCWINADELKSMLLEVKSDE